MSFAARNPSMVNKYTTISNIRQVSGLSGKSKIDKSAVNSIHVVVCLAQGFEMNKMFLSTRNDIGLHSSRNKPITRMLVLFVLPFGRLWFDSCSTPSNNVCENGCSTNYFKRTRQRDGRSHQSVEFHRSEGQCRSTATQSQTRPSSEGMYNLEHSPVKSHMSLLLLFHCRRCWSSFGT